jgi:hypothetical protein
MTVTGTERPKAPSAGLASLKVVDRSQAIAHGVKLNPSCLKRSSCDPADHEISPSKRCPGRNRRMEQSKLVSNEVLSRRMQLLVICAVGNKTATIVTAATHDILRYTNVAMDVAVWYVDSASHVKFRLSTKGTRTIP